jgi:hypothetical protein
VEMTRVLRRLLQFFQSRQFVGFPAGSTHKSHPLLMR